jgi:hypothetical protein
MRTFAYPPLTPFSLVPELLTRLTDRNLAQRQANSPQIWLRLRRVRSDAS